MAHEDSGGYYMKVVLVENGQAIPRRVHLVQWQDDSGVVNSVRGKKLPPDLVLYTGTGFKEEHFARFLGVKTKPQKPWLALPLAKTDLVYVIIGAALVIVLKGALTLAAVAF